MLIQNNQYSYGDELSDNMLIFGDNLIAISEINKSLMNKVKCVYIDPPYNIGKKFTHYNDKMSSNSWIEFMTERIYEMRKLLSEDGSMWISIDDGEQAYLKVACDKIFGRDNFVCNIIWEKKYSPQNDTKWISDNHDFILVYAKNKKIWRPNLLPRTEEMNSRYSNPDNDPRGPWKSSHFAVKTYSDKYDFPITTPSGRVVNPPNKRCWMSSYDKIQELINDNRIYFGKNGDANPSLKIFLNEVRDGIVSRTVWLHKDVGHNHEAINESIVFNRESVFQTPKPERLIERIIHISTKPGDLVLDSFLGSGTTAAVAHKMGRRWIGIEMGEHAITHCYPRLKAVVDGEQGGISKAVNWNGGGGFKFYECK